MCSFFLQLGLRTLCIAHRKLTQAEFEEFDVKLKNAKSALENREEQVSIMWCCLRPSPACCGSLLVFDSD